MSLSPEFREILYRVPALLIAFMGHELSHAAVALCFGDDTAKRAGRITLNPLRHIDPLGALLLILVRFGWAKPVPINPEKFRSKKAGIIAVSLAGPASNVVMAFFAALAVHVPRAFWQNPPMGADVAEVILGVLQEFYLVNIMLAAFNLLPIPPLDGSKAVFSVLPDRIYYGYLMRYERYGMFVLIALSVTGVLGRVLSPVSEGIHSFVMRAMLAVSG